MALDLLQPNAFSADAFVHQFWMWNWRDPQLFTDSLTAELRGSARYPDGYEALFWLATQVAEPDRVRRMARGRADGGVRLARLRDRARAHAPGGRPRGSRPALFLALIEIHRFYGGFPRAFVHPVVLLAVLLAMRRRHLSAALVAIAGSALFYPTAALLATGVLLVSSVGWRDRRPRLERPRIWFALLALAGTVVAVLGPALLSGGAPEVFTAAEARRYPEFGSERRAAASSCPRRSSTSTSNRSGFRPARLRQHPRDRGGRAARRPARERAAAAA